MAKGKTSKLSKIPKLSNWAWWGLWIVGVFASIFMILYASFQIWVSTWQTYKNDEFGFSFRYPEKWYISPDIVSKDLFDMGKFSHGDFDGFIFNIDPKKSVIVGNQYSPSTGGVEVSFYIKNISIIQKDSRPIGCGLVSMKYGEYSCIYEVPDYTSLYIEGDKYVFGVTTRKKSDNLDFKSMINDGFYHFVGKTIIKSFSLTK